MTRITDTSRRPGRLAAVASAFTISALFLSACGGGSDDDSTSEGVAPGSLTDDFAAVYDTNPQERENLQQGGQLTIPVGSMGPNFNIATMDGYFGATIDTMHPMNSGGAWIADMVGDYHPNTDFVLSAEEGITEDGEQILTYELNPDAVWNDGTPIDFYTYQHTVEVNQDPDYNAVGQSLYSNVESIEMGEDEWSFTMTTSSMYQPWESFFQRYSIVHPEVDTAEEFTQGFVHDLNPDYLAGPYKLDVYDEAARTISMVPNENWWGDEPMLDRINFVQYESSANIQAFQNGEIDMVGANTLDRYSEVSDWRTEGEGYEFRRGQNLGDAGFIMNAEARNLGDVEVRKAIFQAIDRHQLADIRFQGLGWEEEVPGSWLVLPFHPLYRDNYPVEDADPSGAMETLEAAGWTGEEGEIRTNDDGEELSIQLDTFGDDPTDAAIAQSFQTMMNAVGIDIDIRNRGAAELTEAKNTGDIAIFMSGYTKGGADVTSGPGWFWGTGERADNPSNIGNDEIDAMIEELPTIVDRDERFEFALDIEEEAIGTFYHFLTYYNGPQILAVRDGLANYGPRLFETLDWTLVGWESESDNDGTDTDIDVEDLEQTDPEDVDEED